MKLFETSKSRVSGRKNYLVSSVENLEENSHDKNKKSRGEVLASSIIMQSP